MRAVYMVSQVAMELRAGMWPLAGAAPGPAVYHPRLVSSNSQAFQLLMTSLTRSDRPDLTTTAAILPSKFIVELMPPNYAPDATRRQLMHSSAASIWRCEITRLPFALWSQASCIRPAKTRGRSAVDEWLALWPCDMRFGSDEAPFAGCCREGGVIC